MPYVEGETLRARLERERQLPLGDALRIAAEVVDALAYAHARGVVHRDVKPENVLLQGGHALVADFGIALAVEQAGGIRMTQTGLSLGTPQYMSPEQAMGERAVDARSDVYALGAVLYEMLVGEPPFTGATSQAIPRERSVPASAIDRPRDSSEVTATSTAEGVDRDARTSPLPSSRPRTRETPIEIPTPGTASSAPYSAMDRAGSSASIPSRMASSCRSRTTRAIARSWRPRDTTWSSPASKCWGALPTRARCWMAAPALVRLPLFRPKGLSPATQPKSRISVPNNTSKNENR